MLINRRVSVCCKFQGGALFGSPVSHSLCSLREIQLVCHSFLPAVHRAQGFTFALLRMNHSDASLGPFCFICGVGTWQGQTSSLPLPCAVKGEPCWSGHFSDMGRTGHRAAGREGSWQQQQPKPSALFPSQKACKQLSPRVSMQ